MRLLRRHLALVALRPRATRRPPSGPSPPRPRASRCGGWRAQVGQRAGLDRRDGDLDLVALDGLDDAGGRPPAAWIVPIPRWGLGARVGEHPRVADEPGGDERDADAGAGEVGTQAEARSRAGRTWSRVDRGLAGWGPCPPARRRRPGGPSPRSRIAGHERPRPSASAPPGSRAARAGSPRSRSSPACRYPEGPRWRPGRPPRPPRRRAAPRRLLAPRSAGATRCSPGQRARRARSARRPCGR